MGKRPSNNGNDDEMGEITHHLERQDKTLQEILIVLRGSVSLGVNGVVDKLKEMDIKQEKTISDIAHLQRWQKMMRENKGKFTLSWLDGAKIVFSVIGVAGTFVAIFLGLKELFDGAQ